MTVTFRLACAMALALSSIGNSLAAPTSAPPAEHRPGVPAKAAVRLALPEAPALRIVLPEVSAEERGALRQKNAAARTAGAKAAKRAAVGFARPMPAAAQVLPLAALDWRTTADGDLVARVEVRSPGAGALRLALGVSRPDPDLSLRFAGRAGSEVHGPYAASAIASAAARLDRYLTPVLDGDTATVELHLDAGALPGDAALVIERVSHLVVGPSGYGTLSPKDASDIGASGSCNIDVACVQPSSALQRASQSVGKLLFDDRQGFSYLCTGTLLNDTVTSFTPYVFSAAHCLTEAYEAETTDVFWFFQAQSCGSRQTPPYVQQTGGAALLARSDDWDWALVRLRGAPPAGAFFAAWRAEPIPTGAIATSLHHPRGDLMKFAQGTMRGLKFFSDGTTFHEMQWSDGTTEQGSSGSGLITFLAAGNYYEVRGGLFGGEASCSNRNGPDWYSRMDTMLPVVRQYLTPNAPVTGSQTVAVEFYNRALDHYFLSTDPNEINGLDTGVFRGWERTGQRFLAYSSPVAGANPVCRFYMRPEFGDSHFYSADPAECERVRQLYAREWIYESPAVFYIALPNAVTGACPSGMQSVWRFFNKRTINHRYTVEVAQRDAMRARPSEWVPEGYGADAVIMCSPTGYGSL